MANQTTVKTVAFVGLGKAGYPMASNLPRAGFHLVVRDTDSEREKKFAAEYGPNVHIASDAADFGNAEVVVTMLPQGKVVRAALLGTGGTIIIDLSSSSPYDTQSLGAELKGLNLTLMDSPVTQTRLHDTDTGNATLMVGTDSQEAFEKALPVLQAMAKYVFHMGGLGSGHVMKTLNNYISAASIIALSDSLVAGTKFGLDPRKMIDVLNVGTGRNFSTTDSYRTDALSRRYNSGFQLALLIKDVGIAQEFFEREAFETRLPGLISGYLKDAMNALGREDVDHTECLRAWEMRAGVKLPEGTPDGSSVSAVKK